MAAVVAGEKEEEEEEPRSGEGARRDAKTNEREREMSDERGSCRLAVYGTFFMYLYLVPNRV